MKKKKRLSGIERRWFVNNVGVIMLLVAACVLGVVFSMAAYYDTNLRSGLENKAKTTTDFFSNYISQSYKEYYQSCIKFAQTFEEKDRLELQFISANGKLVASSYGKFAGRSPSTPEIQQAIDSQQIRHYKGRNPLTGERILAVSSPMIYTNGEVIGVLRYVTSLRNADLQILMIALIAVTIVLSIRIMGIVLLISLLTMPVAIVNSLSRSYPSRRSTRRPSALPPAPTACRSPVSMTTRSASWSAPLMICLSRSDRRKKHRQSSFPPCRMSFERRLQPFPAGVRRF